MKHYSKILVVLFVIVIFFQLFLSDKTRDGKPFEKFERAKTGELTSVLRDYMWQNYIPYTYYKVPNYVMDFIEYDKVFSSAYRSGKYIIITFPNEKSRANQQSLKNFYESLDDIIHEYGKRYVYIKRNETVPPHFVLKSDKLGYRDLKSYCNNFCIINPNNKRMFAFTRTTDTEIEALELVLQQFILCVNQ